MERGMHTVGFGWYIFQTTVGNGQQFVRSIIRTCLFPKFVTSLPLNPLAAGWIMHQLKSSNYP